MGIQLVKKSGNIDLTSPKIIGDPVPVQEFFIGTEEPTDEYARFWLNPEGTATEGLATVGYVDEAIKNIDISDIEIDMSDYVSKEELTEALDIKADKDFIVGVNELNMADKTWAEVYEAREAGSRVILTFMGRRYDYLEEGYDFSRFMRISNINKEYVDLYDWTQQVNFSSEPFTDLTGYATESYVDKAVNNYALKTELDDFITEAQVDEKGYQTEAQVNALINDALGVIENGSY